jgi:hypothetical protein
VGGSFYIFGGINSMANLNDIYQFDISTCAIHVSPSPLALGLAALLTFTFIYSF